MIAQFKKDWLIIAIVVLPFVAVAAYWSEFPETVARTKRVCYTKRDW